MYTDFASIYDRLMSDVDYKSWAEYYLSLIETINPDATDVVECACGTGNLSLYFANKFNLIACDISEDMLSLALQKADDWHKDICFVQQDMCKLSLPYKQDIVICTCDGVNYLINKRQAKSFFKSANKALKIGGGIIFDVSSQYKLYKLLPEKPLVNFDEEISYIWQNYVERQKLYMDLSFFVKDNGVYNRIDEQQTQVCFSKNEYKEMLKSCGFGKIKIFGDRTYSQPSSKELRWHFLATKMNEV